MPGPSQAQKDEISLAIADTVATCFTEYNGCPPALERKVEADTKLTPLPFSRGEYTKLIDSKTAAPDVRILANIGRAAIYDTAMVFGQIKQEEVSSAFYDLKAATEVPGGKDEYKARAFFEIVELATRIKDYNTVAGAYERVTLLPAATVEQKIKAYEGLISILLANNMIKVSRDQLATAHKLAGLTNPQKAKLYRLGALATMTDVDPSDAAALAKQKKAAIAELDKTAAFPGMTDEDKFKTYIANAEYFQNNARAYTLALDHLDKALKLKKIDDRGKTQAQYQIGETYRIHKDYAKARDAYNAVSEANPQYRNYAVQRLKQIDAETAAHKP
jgi:tetratricopeptide (TPR) repeat protein